MVFEEGPRNTIHQIHIISKLMSSYAGGVGSITAACPVFFEIIPVAVTFEFREIDCITIR